MQVYAGLSGVIKLETTSLLFKGIICHTKTLIRSLILCRLVLGWFCFWDHFFRVGPRTGINATTKIPPGFETLLNIFEDFQVIFSSNGLRM